MAKRRAQKRALIRRKRLTPAQEEAVSSVVETEQRQDASEDDWGFVTGFRAGDFVRSEIEGDFVSDNEVAVSDELFEEFEEVFGANGQLGEQVKSAADSVGRAVGMMDSI